MGCSSSIGRGPDSAKVILSRGPGQEATVTLKIAVSLVLLGGFGMKVDSLVVDLPDLNQGVAKGLPFYIHHDTTKIAYRSGGGGDLVIHNEKVVIGVQR